MGADSQGRAWLFKSMLSDPGRAQRGEDWAGKTDRCSVLGEDREDLVCSPTQLSTGAASTFAENADLAELAKRFQRGRSIDAKRYAGKVERRDVGGLLRTDERLYVGGRDRTNLVAAVVKQCDVVRTALHRIAAQQDLAAGVEVRGVLCFVGADWPGWRLKPPRIGGVTCAWPEALASLFRGAANPSTVIDQRAVAAALAAAFPSA